MRLNPIPDIQFYNTEIEAMKQQRLKNWLAIVEDQLNQPGTEE